MDIKAMYSKLNMAAIKRKTPMFIWSIARFVLLCGFSYVILYPLLVKFSLVFMDEMDLKDVTVKWIPRHFTFDNILTAIRYTDYWNTLFNTILFCAAVSVIQIAICMISSYAFARFKFKFRGLVFAIVIGTLVVPPQTYMVPLFEQLKDLNVLNTIWPFILMAVTGMGIRSGLYIYVLRQAFRGMPKELEEAANVDGAGPMRTFLQVMCPNVVPTTLLCLILSFVWLWNDTFYVSMFAPQMEIMPVLVKRIRTLITSAMGGWNENIGNIYTSVLVNTGTLLSMVPIIILFIVCQKFFVQGVERSGLVG